ncbi:hypothetical protein CP500_022810 [Tychonema bourrellyi FEM_GT703]|uniref:Uncharacterized protein n=1 Tax=Tychonema bourrellyi FEM_GT703 TaxID=2040638 RepID=A0A2G4EUH2_9CYAN|nr:hypothetical protein CP500_022810 [Tychonema bourrellyi FEM_GT703]
MRRHLKSTNQIDNLVATHPTNVSVGSKLGGAFGTRKYLEFETNNVDLWVEKLVYMLAQIPMI